jgi:hypothetical protein
MKNNLFRRTAYCLLLLMGPGGGLFAEAPGATGVTVNRPVVTPGSPSTVTFGVSWTKNDPSFMWSDTVWVFVDYNDQGTMTRLPLAEGATLTATSAQGVGKVEQISGNTKGAWVVGNARDESNSAGSFSATVQLFADVADVSGACVYAINYPPVGRYTTPDQITFTGTPPFTLTLPSETVSILRDENNNYTYSVVANIRPDSFTDASGAPGIFIYSCYAGTIGGKEDE